MSSNNTSATIAIDTTATTSITNKLYVGGFAGYVASLTYSNKITFTSVTISTGAVNTNKLCVGGFAGFVDGLTSSNEMTFDDVAITTTATTNELYVGGAIGYVSTNGATVGSMTLTNCTINAYATVNGTGSEGSTGEQGVCDLGGFVGYAETLTANNCKVDELTIKTNTSSVKNSTSIGGFGGYINLQGSTNCYAGNVAIGLTNASLGANVYVGGFAGSGIINLKNGFAKGKINLPSNSTTSQNIFAGGFVGQFQKRDGNSTLEMCFADVEIKANATSTNLHMAGFANINNEKDKTPSVSLTKCVSLGNLIYTNGAYNGYATGFVDYVTSGVNTCYSMSTLKLISGTNANVSTDYLGNIKNSSSSINFSYNLSGSVYYNGGSQNNIKNYNDLATSVRSLISDNSYIKSKYGNKTGETFNFTQCTKINPVLLENSATLTENSYYYATNTFVVDINNKSVNLIANDQNTGVLLTLSGSTTIGQNAFISGFAFKVDSSKYINQNNGYLFNCLALSQKDDDGTFNESNFATVGFVNENTGFINACGTTANIKGATSGTACGFVNTNRKSGVIANSFANGIIHNITKSGTNAGFVGTNTGSILNSYASTTMFNRNTADDKAYNNCYGFVSGKSGNIKNCYYDTSSTKSAGQASNDLTAIVHKKLTNEKDSNGNYVSPLYSLNIKLLNCTREINYGICSTISHKNYLKSGMEESKTYTSYIKNIEQLKDLIGYLNENKSKFTNINIFMLTNLDGGILSNSSNNQGGTIIDKPNNPGGTITPVNPGDKTIDQSNNINYAIDNSLIDQGSTTANKPIPSDTPSNSLDSLSNQNLSISLKTIVKNKTNKNYQYAIYNISLLNALLSAKEITLQDVGLIASLRSAFLIDIISQKTNAIGMFVGSATTLTATNCYAVLKNNITVTGSTFGILAGDVKNCYITNSFTSGDFSVNTTSSANIGHMVGKISTKATMTDVFTNGIIKISKTTASSLYVGGIVGNLSASEKYDSNYSYVLANSYSNVAIKNYAINNSNVYVGAIAGYFSYRYKTEQFVSSPFGSSTDANNKVEELNSAIDNLKSNNLYLVDKVIYASSYQYAPSGFAIKPGEITYITNMPTTVYFDPNISLVDYYFGNVDVTSDKTTNALFTHNPFDGNDIVRSINHFPLQSVFAGNVVVYEILSIDDNKQTGSRMSPISVDSVNNLETDKFYYLNQDLTCAGNYKLSNVSLYGRGHTITKSDTSKNVYLFDTVTDSVITGLTIKNMILANKVTNSFIKNCNTSGNISGTVSGFINSANGNVYLSGCQVNLTSLTSSSSAVGGLIGSVRGTNYIQNPVVSISSISLTNTKITCFGGIIGSPEKDSITYIKNPKISKLEILSSSTSNSLIFGGISAYADSSSTINLSGAVTINEILIDRSNNTTEYNLGLLYGKFTITEEITLFDPSFKLTSDNSNIALKFACSNDDQSENAITENSNCNIYAGTFGKLTDDSSKVDVDLDNLNIAKPLNFDITGGYRRVEIISLIPLEYKIHENLALVHVGGIAGIAEGSNTYLNAKLPKDLNVTLNYSYRNYVGGIVGKVTGGVSFTDFVQSGNVCVTDNNTKANTYVGGFAGYSDTTGKNTGTSTGLVVATSNATSAPNTTSVKDARTSENNVKKSVDIPLAVGGIYGFYYSPYDSINNINDIVNLVNGVSKTSGSVRALLIGDNSRKGLSNKVEEEKIQCRAGAFAGLAKFAEGVTINPSKSKMQISTGNNQESSCNYDGTLDSQFNRKELSQSAISASNISSKIEEGAVDNGSALGIRIIDRWYGLEVINGRTYTNETAQKNKDSIFAGYTFGGKTYNRSFWIEISTSYSGIPPSETETNTLKAIEHWAGMSVGGYVQN